MSAAAASNALTSVAAAAEAGSCSSVPPDKGLLLVSPQGAELPIGASANLEASSFAPALAVGEKVTFRIICGPDTPAAGVSTVALHPQSSTPGVPIAYIPFGNQGRAGTDVVVVTATAGSQQLTDVVQLQWVEPVNCGEGPSKLGYVLALECKAKRLAPLLHTALNMVSCGVGLAGFLVPAAKLADLFSAADEAATATQLATDAAVSTPVAKLSFDLDQISKTGIVSISQLYSDLRDAKSAAQFLENIVDLLKAIPTHDVNEIALDVADLAGLDGCVTLLAQLVHAHQSLGSSEASSRVPFTKFCTALGCQLENGPKSEPRNPYYGQPLPFTPHVSTYIDWAGCSQCGSSNLPFTYNFTRPNTCLDLTLEMVMGDGNASFNPNDHLTVVLSQQGAQPQSVGLLFHQVVTKTFSLTGLAFQLHLEVASGLENFYLIGGAATGCRTPSGAAT